MWTNLNDFIRPFLLFIIIILIFIIIHHNIIIYFGNKLYFKVKKILR